MLTCIQCYFKGNSESEISITESVSNSKVTLTDSWCWRGETPHVPPTWRLEASILKSGRGFNNVSMCRCLCKYCVLWPVLLFWFYCPKHCCDGSLSRWQTMWNIRALDFHQGSLRFSHNEGQFIHWHSIYNSVDEATTPVMTALEPNLCCHFVRFHPIWFLW